jgi:hypothetical protein
MPISSRKRGKLRILQKKRKLERTKFQKRRCVLDVGLPSEKHLATVLELECRGGLTTRYSSQTG